MLRKTPDIQLLHDITSTPAMKPLQDLSTMNEQQDSPFFRIPRQLSDEIYYYYTLEEGYHHDSTSRKLRLANGDPINLALQYICKKATKEMAGLALETNTVTFCTMLDVPEPGSKFSKAAYWDHLLRERQRPLQRMFCWSYPLVTHESMRKLQARYPDSIAVNRIESFSSRKTTTV
jgi:hypothetical protein